MDPALNTSCSTNSEWRFWIRRTTIDISTVWGMSKYCIDDMLKNMNKKTCRLEKPEFKKWRNKNKMLRKADLMILGRLPRSTTKRQMQILMQTISRQIFKRKKNSQARRRNDEETRINLRILVKKLSLFKEDIWKSAVGKWYVVGVTFAHV